MNGRGYEPFPIYDFKTGLQLSKKPWLLPRDAFKTITNAYLYQGVLQKRLGFKFFGKMSHIGSEVQNGGFESGAISPWVAYWGGGTGGSFTVSTSDPYKGTYKGFVDITSGGSEEDDIEIYQNNIAITKDKKYKLVFAAKAASSRTMRVAVTEASTPYASYGLNKEVNLTTSWQEYHEDFTATTTTDNARIRFLVGGQGPIDVDLDYIQLYDIPELPIMGIHNYYTSSGVSELLAFDTKRFARWNIVQKVFEDITGADEWTGDNDKFVWTENWLNRLFITNNKDRVMSYDGTDLTDLMMDIDNDSVNEVDSCLLLFAHKDRLIALRTSEDGVLFPQRARWCKAGDPDNWKEAEGGGYADAPTIDWIMGAEFIGDDLVVCFERSVWSLKYTGNPSAPFKWMKITVTQGCYAPFSVTNYADEILFVGPTGLLGCDGYEVYPIDEKVPDLLLNANPEKLHYCYGAILEELRQNWWLYPSQGQQLSDKALILNYVENSFSIYDIAIHSIGYYNESEDLTLDDIDETFDELEITFDEKSTQAGYPINLAGDAQGQIFQLNNGGNDNGQAISLDIETGRWNPFANEGFTARLGKIEFLVDRDPSISIYIDFYMDNINTPYKTETLTFDSENNVEEKVWKTVYCGVVANSHRIRIYHSASAQTPVIHAIIPYFKPAGKII